MITTFLLYFSVPILIAIRGGVLTAGLVMLTIAFLPIAWQVLFTDADAPGFVFLVAMMLPIPLLLIAAGLILWLVRITQRMQRPQA
jgi:hypothetical protein